MRCTACGHDGREGLRFCEECGAALARRCNACGADASPTAKFCGGCGAALVAAPPPPSGVARKVVTIVFADLIGSTALHERLDAESARAFMERYYAAMRGAVEARAADTVTQLLGDGVKAVFGAPRVAEDDAIRAVRAAVGMQRAFRALADAQREAVGAIGLRVAVNTRRGRRAATRARSSAIRSTSRRTCRRRRATATCCSAKRRGAWSASR